MTLHGPHICVSMALSNAGHIHTIEDILVATWSAIRADICGGTTSFEDHDLMSTTFAQSVGEHQSSSTSATLSVTLSGEVEYWLSIPADDAEVILWLEGPHSWCSRILIAREVWQVLGHNK